MTAQTQRELPRGKSAATGSGPSRSDHICSAVRASALLRFPLLSSVNNCTHVIHTLVNTTLHPNLLKYIARSTDIHPVTHMERPPRKPERPKLCNCQKCIQSSNDGKGKMLPPRTYRNHAKNRQAEEQARHDAFFERFGPPSAPSSSSANVAHRISRSRKVCSIYNVLLSSIYKTDRIKILLQTSIQQTRRMVYSALLVLQTILCLSKTLPVLSTTCDTLLVPRTIPCLSKTLPVPWDFYRQPGLTESVSSKVGKKGTVVLVGGEGYL